MRKQVETGIFAGPITGLAYRTPTQSGITNARGEFEYVPGEAITFRADGRAMITISEGDHPAINVIQASP